MTLLGFGRGCGRLDGGEIIRIGRFGFHKEGLALVVLAATHLQLRVAKAVFRGGGLPNWSAIIREALR